MASRGLLHIALAILLCKGTAEAKHKHKNGAHDKHDTQHRDGPHTAKADYYVPPPITVSEEAVDLADAEARIIGGVFTTKTYVLTFTTEQT